MQMRESIIYHTAITFKPDIFLVDKEPTGLQGEVLSTLEMLHQRGLCECTRVARRHG